MSATLNLILSVLHDEGAVYRLAAILDQYALKTALDTSTMVRVVKSETKPETFDVKVRGPSGWWTYTKESPSATEASSISDALVRRHGLILVRW